MEGFNTLADQTRIPKSRLLMRPWMTFEKLPHNRP
jgi:hypothetical protein